MLFQLKKIADNPIFEGFASGKAKSVLRRSSKITGSDSDSIFDDFFPGIPVGWDWKAEPLAPDWKTFEAEGNVASFNDFPCLDLLIPAFSGRARVVLHDFLEPNGELLPFTYKSRTYFAYNCLKIVEILDHLNTIGAFGNNYSAKKNKLTVASSISYMTVIPERLEGLSIFKMRELPNRTFVTDEFVDRVQGHGLNGFDFVKAWPMPKELDITHIS